MLQLPVHDAVQYADRVLLFLQALDVSCRPDQSHAAQNGCCATSSLAALPLHQISLVSFESVAAQSAVMGGAVEVAHACFVNW